MEERHCRCKIEYVTPAEIDRLHQNTSYAVIGEIGNLAHQYPDQDVVLSHDGKLVPIFPRGSAVKPLEWIAGYALVEENTYVAVTKSVVPKFLSNLFFKRRKSF